MLVNFCNPNQLLAAINIDGSVMTFFYRPNSGIEARAFGKYLSRELGVKKFPGAEHEDDKTKHYFAFHTESIHLRHLEHQHFDFQYPVDKDTGVAMINGIRKYIETLNTRVTYEDTLQKHIVKYNEKNTYTLKNYVRNFGLTVESTTAIISHADLDRLADEFDELPKPIFSSTSKIVNFLDLSMNTHDLHVPVALSMQERLIANTCPEVAGIMTAQERNLDIFMMLTGAVTGLLASAMVVGGVYVYNRYFNKNSDYPQNETAAEPVMTRRQA